MNKRILSLLLAIVMVLGVCAAGFTAFAADPTYKSISSTRHTKSEEGKDDVTEAHTFDYDYNHNGTHTVKCVDCDFVSDPIPCIGSCVCGSNVKGYKEVLEPEKNENGEEVEVPSKTSHIAIVSYGLERKECVVAHKFIAGRCACGYRYFCASQGHVVEDKSILYSDALSHYNVCDRCGYKVYENENGEYEYVTVSQNGEVKPSTAKHLDTEILEDESLINNSRTCLVCGNEREEKLNEYGDTYKTGHNHYFIKSDNQEAKCNQFPFDTYQCIQCAHVVTVKLGDMLGHYWPVKLDKNEEPVYVDANGNTVSEEAQEKYLVADDRYIEVKWGDNNESCTITMTCMRPTCDAKGHESDGTPIPQTITYSVYTKRNNEIGKIVKKDYDAPACKESSTTYTAYFKIPNIPKYIEGDFIYYRAETQKVTTPATAAHSKGDVISSKAPTCTEEGKTTYKCAECGEAFSETTPATNHNIGEAVVVREATCSAEGLSEAKCQNPGCTHSKTESIAKTEHKFGAEEKIEATCTERGGTAVECEVCHYKKYSEATTPALGHDYSVRDSDSEGNTWLKCSRCGEKKATLCNGNHNDTKYDIDFDRVCDVCGGKIAFAPNALHYIVGIPQFWMRVVFRMLIGGDWKAMFITRSK